MPNIIEDALFIIIARSPYAGHEAAQTLLALHAGSPIVARRYEHTLALALRDRDATFTAEERETLANAARKCAPDKEVEP